MLRQTSINLLYTSILWVWRIPQGFSTYATAPSWRLESTATKWPYADGTRRQADFDRIRPLHYAGAHAIIIYFAIDSRASLESVEAKVQPPGHPVVLLGGRGLRATPARAPNSSRTPSPDLAEHSSGGSESNQIQESTVGSNFQTGRNVVEQPEIPPNKRWMRDNKRTVSRLTDWVLVPLRSDLHPTSTIGTRAAKCAASGNH
ncbi:hypothetical protein LshimejAT787_0701300 [Lyophyllum shimeji]|uniref:Uncharacterized protein n=1 Tax=Lyophyllum shimeji TaxID=47721 RepID=A0A9P3PPF0_LYOSH|nr:hypothetical protein LshimejAT787_0701300 [Lyophyllum shimeji]